MSKETLNNEDSNNSKNQSINQEKILNGSSKDSLELKFDQLVNKIDELIASQKTLVEAVINSNEEQKKAVAAMNSSVAAMNSSVAVMKSSVAAMNSSVEVMKSSLSNQNQLIQLIKELFTKGEKDENSKKEK